MRAVAPARTVDERLRAAGRPYDLVAGMACAGEACPGLPAEAEAAGIRPADLVRGVLLVSPTGVLGESPPEDAGAPGGRRAPPAGRGSVGRRAPGREAGLS